VVIAELAAPTVVAVATSVLDGVGLDHTVDKWSSTLGTFLALGFGDYACSLDKSGLDIPRQPPVDRPITVSRLIFCDQHVPDSLDILHV
jgi:hypothetical protein